MYKRIHNGKTEYSQCRSIRASYAHHDLKPGQCVSNPPQDLIDAEGWEPYVVPPPQLYEGEEPIPEDNDYIEFISKHKEFEDIFYPVKDSVIYHYTTWSTLFNGILSNENISSGKAVLRAYSINYMNDESEGLQLPYLFSDIEKEKYPNPSNKIASARMSRYEMFRYTARCNKLKLFSISFSHNPDSLPMWNYYGQNGRGLSIGFNVSDILYQGYNLYDCIYDNCKKSELGNCLYDNYRGRRIVDKVGLLFKDDHFEYEAECRIPILSFDKKYCLNSREQFFPINYDIKDGLIVPYVDIYLPLTAIKEIYIGPTSSPSRAVDSLISWLDSIGISGGIKVSRSSAPLAAK